MHTYWLQLQPHTDNIQRYMQTCDVFPQLSGLLCTDPNCQSSGLKGVVKHHHVGRVIPVLRRAILQSWLEACLLILNSTVVDTLQDRTM